MKPILNPLLSLVALLCGFAGARVGNAAPVLETTAVQTEPDPAAPVITFLKAGSEPVPDADAIARTPAGWLAVDVAGPFEGYVQNKDLTKGLEVKPGSAIRLAPKSDSGVLATAEKGDKISITGLRGKWTQVRLEKTLVAYIRLGPSPANSPADLSAAAATKTDQNSSLPPTPVSSGPVDLSTPAPAPSGHAAATGSDGGNGALPRFFEGKFASSRRLFKPRRPYDWEIDDSSGARIAYLDLSKLLLTEQIASYVNHNVEVFGAVNAVPSSPDIVIAVESLRLK